MIQDILNKKTGKIEVVEQIIRAYKQGRRDFSSIDLLPGSKFVTANLSCSSFDASSFIDVEFENCDLSQCFFTSIWFEGKITFTKCNLTNVYIKPLSSGCIEPAEFLFKNCEMKKISLEQHYNVKYTFWDCRIKFS